MKLIRAVALAVSAALSPLSFLPAAATAQDVLGTITATLDGEAREWVSIHEEGSQNGSYFAVLMPGVILVMIHGMYGHAPKEDRWGRDWIDMTFQLEGEAVWTEAQLEGVKISYHPQGLYPHYSSENGGEARITLTGFAPWGPRGWAEGTYSAVLVRVDSAGNPDPGDTLVVEGEFAVILLELM